MKNNIRIYQTKNKIWLAHFKQNGKYTSKSFKTKSDALLFKKQQLNEQQIEKDIQLTIQQRNQILSITPLIEKYSFSVDELINILVLNGEKKLKSQQLLKTTLDDAKTMWTNHLRTLKRSETTIISYLDEIKILNYKNLNIDEDKAKEIIFNSSRGTKRLRSINQFYNFCINQKFCLENPFKNIKIERPSEIKKLPDILTIDEAKSIFKTVPEIWKPVFALQLFTGIRPSEICKMNKNKDALRIKNIDFINKKILVPAEITKKRRDRILYDLPDNLWKYLEQLKDRNNEELIMPESYSNYRRIFRKTVAYNRQDVFRHSFATYGYHFLGEEKTKEIMGHSKKDERTFDINYKNYVSKEDANEYFKL